MGLERNFAEHPPPHDNYIERIRGHNNYLNIQRAMHDCTDIYILTLTVNALEAKILPGGSKTGPLYQGSVYPGRKAVEEAAVSVSRQCLITLIDHEVNAESYYTYQGKLTA